MNRPVGDPKDARPTVAIETLGCRLNQYESEAIATTLDRRGYRVDSFAPDADAYVINGCTVTAKADRKTRNLVNRALRGRQNGAGVIVTGCFVDGHPSEVSPEDGIYYVPNRFKHAIPEILEAHLKGELVDLEALGADVFGFAPPGRVFHTRTTIKIQDGCDNFCTFCIVPHVRGRARSRDPREILREAQAALHGGARELVLTGVNMSRYAWIRRADTGKADTGSQETVDFTAVIRSILELDGDFRLRLSSLEPDRLDARFVDLFGHPGMAPHLHLCLQSASPRALLAMRRMYTLQDYREIVAALREIDPLFNVTSDMIVGFPGETEEDHQAGIAAIHEFGFGHVHTFPFSPRHGTRADRMPNQIDEKTKKLRAQAIRDAAEQAKRRYRQQFLGRTERVLIERIERQQGALLIEGLGEHYIPIRARVSDVDEARPNTFVKVRIDGIEEGDDPRLRGTCLPDREESAEAHPRGNSG